MKRRGIGDSCGEDTQCASGFCDEGRCLDPDGDEDGDTLINRRERDFGSDPLKVDTDDDGVIDPSELGPGLQLLDSDGDGRPDIVESALRDGDADCIADQFDARDGEPNGEDSPLVASACPSDGVCGSNDAVRAVSCANGLEAPICDLSRVPNYEEVETSCDGRDNDCDGSTDTPCDSLVQGLIGHWRLDGDGRDSGFFETHGRVIDATPARDRFGNENKALRFAAGARVEVEDTRHPRGGTTSSYAVWVRPDPTPDPWVDNVRGVFAFGDVFDANRSSAIVLREGRGCATWLGGGNDATARSACTPGGHWTHLAVVKDDRNVRIYIDGRETDVRVIGAGHDLQQGRLIIGAARQFGSQAPTWPFEGVLDDLRVWDRPLTVDEIRRLYTEEGWADAGSGARPGAHCLHVRDAAGVTTSGPQRIDVDGDGPRPAFDAWCDMETEGGGWTLVWSYEFTRFEGFTSVANAVTPVPNWPASSADVAVSTQPPSSPSALGAVPWTDWKWLGREFHARSELSNDVICQHATGSLSDGVSGGVQCRLVGTPVPGCTGALPRNIVFTPVGPRLDATLTVWSWDGSQTRDVPWHDPCGESRANHRTDVATRGGSLWLRPTVAPMRWPTQCDDYASLERIDGFKTIDPDGRGGEPPFIAECLFSIERGGWTRLDGGVLAAMQARDDAPRQYLYRKGPAFYRSPVTETSWSPDSFDAVPGLWHGAGANGDIAFDCGSGLSGRSGIGCGASGEGRGRVLPENDFDPETATLTVCQPTPDLFGTGGIGCEPEVEVWMREEPCPPDEGSLIGDGAFDDMGQLSVAWDSPCWSAFGNGGWLGGYSFPDTNLPPDTEAPVVRVENSDPTSEIHTVQLAHRRFGLVAGRHYRLSFRARAESPRTLRAQLRSRSFLFIASSQDFGVDDAWRTHVFSFDATRTLWDAQLDFQFGGPVTAAVWIDDVVLEDAGPAACGVSDDGNTLGNGDFAAGAGCWQIEQAAGLASPWVLETGSEAGVPFGRVVRLGAGEDQAAGALAHPTPPFAAGARLQVQFKASGEPMPLVVRWSDAEDGTTWLEIERQIDATPWAEVTTQTMEFNVPPEASERPGRLAFGWYGAGPLSFIIGDVQLRLLDPP